MPKKTKPERKELSQQNRRRLHALSIYCKELRVAEGFTQSEVCKHTNMHKNTLIKIEKKHMNFGIVHLFELADFYGVPVKDILWNVE